MQVLHVAILNIFFGSGTKSNDLFSWALVRAGRTDVVLLATMWTSYWILTVLKRSTVNFARSDSLYPAISFIVSVLLLILVPQILSLLKFCSWQSAWLCFFYSGGFVDDGVLRLLGSSLVFDEFDINGNLLPIYYSLFSPINIQLVLCYRSTSASPFPASLSCLTVVAGEPILSLFVIADISGLHGMQLRDGIINTRSRVKLRFAVDSRPWAHLGWSLCYPGRRLIVVCWFCSLIIIIGFLVVAGSAVRDIDIDFNFIASSFCLSGGLYILFRGCCSCCNILLGCVWHFCLDGGVGVCLHSCVLRFDFWVGFDLYESVGFVLLLYSLLKRSNWFLHEVDGLSVAVVLEVEEGPYFGCDEFGL